MRRWVREWKAAHGWGRQEAVVPLDPGGIFRELVYDNLTQSVKRILRGKKRREQERFVSFRSHYTYRARYCTPGQGQGKGGVEGLIGFARRNFLVPLPRVRDFEEPNDSLAQRCEQYGTHPIGAGKIPVRWKNASRRNAPPYGLYPIDPLRTSSRYGVKGDTYQTARVDHNRYSVPRAHVGCWLWRTWAATRFSCTPTIGRSPNTIESFPRARGRSIRSIIWI